MFVSLSLTLISFSLSKYKTNNFLFLEFIEEPFHTSIPWNNGYNFLHKKMILL